MSLRERLGVVQSIPTQAMEQAKNDERESSFQEFKARVHYNVIDQMDLSILSDSPTEQAEKDLESAIRIILESESGPLSAVERENLILEIKNEVLGLGPLEPLLADPTINDILVNRYNQVYVERKGRLTKVPVRFRDDAHLLKIIDKIATAVGRRIDESSPMVDARLADGSRVNAIIPPLAMDGPSMSIRKFSVDPFKVDDLIRLRLLQPGARPGHGGRGQGQAQRAHQRRHRLGQDHHAQRAFAPSFRQ